MSSNLNSSMMNMSVHSDILSAAVPSDAASKTSMVTELKNRARVCVKSRDWPSADSLYSKALEVVATFETKDDRESAVLHSNRSLVLLQMNRLEESLEDAERATSLDDRYVKGFWRAGQACAALERWPEAVAAFDKAVDLEPTNKALRKEVDRCRRKADEQARNGTVSNDTNNEKRKADKKITTTTVETKKTTTAKTKSANSNGNSDTTTTTIEDTAEFGSSDHVRGYKIVDGKKTSFFHHEQTEEEKRLIGDIAPKRLDPASANNNNSSDAAAASGSSAWNTAGTWEEKDVTSWAKESLETLLKKARYELPESSPSPGSVATVTKVKKVTGHASTALARGKRRYIYELGVELEWTMSFPNEEKDARGSLSFPDVDGTCGPGEYEMTDYKVEDSSGGGARHLLDRFVRNGGLRDEVVRRIDEWVELLKTTYA